jgi:hypothetical protein
MIKIDVAAAVKVYEENNKVNMTLFSAQLKPTLTILSLILLRKTSFSQYLVLWWQVVLTKVVSLIILI